MDLQSPSEAWMTQNSKALIQGRDWSKDTQSAGKKSGPGTSCWPTASPHFPCPVNGCSVQVLIIHAGCPLATVIKMK